MMARFCAYVDKVFPFREHLLRLRDNRKQPVISTATVFLAAFLMFASHRPSLNALQPDLRIPARLRRLVGRRVPSVDTVARVFGLMGPDPLRDWLAAVAGRLKRNKALATASGYYVAAVDGHELFSSRKRCCAQCMTRTRTVRGEQVTEYYHRIVACHLIGHDIALPLDAELIQPGEGEETAAKRLLERVCARYGRFFDVISGDALYFDAPFLKFCRSQHKHPLVVVKGEGRLLLEDTAAVFAQQAPGEWTVERGRVHRTVQYWDVEGFTSCEGFDEPLRVLHTRETTRRRERVAGQWQETEVESTWYWATTLTQRQMPTQQLWKAAHHRWDIENDCFNTLSTHWGLDHCFRHDATAILNFVLTLFLAYVLLQCFWSRNLKPAARSRWPTLIGLAEELARTLVEASPVPWLTPLPQPP